MKNKPRIAAINGQEMILKLHSIIKATIISNESVLKNLMRSGYKRPLKYTKRPFYQILPKKDLADKLRFL